MVGEEMYRWLRDVEGFEGLLVPTNLEAGMTHVVRSGEREVAERHRVARETPRPGDDDRRRRGPGTEPYDVAFAALPGLHPAD